MLELIGLDIDELGYSKFISSWVYRGEGGSFVVDPGPACTIGTLLDALERMGIKRLDWVLLTHIHIDHSGGIGHLVERFPEVRVSAHEKAVSHLVDPERLWEGSLKILGSVAETYGRIKPVPADRIITADRISFEDGIEVIPSPGHAAHHQCFAFSDRLFCGEVFGIFQDLGESIYLRPATPPRFILEEFLASIDRVAPYTGRTLCFSHYGSFPDGRRVCRMFREQLLLWVDVIGRHVDNPDMEAIFADLVANDPVFARINSLPGDIYNRERYYVGNTIKGMLEYIRNK